MCWSAAVSLETFSLACYGAILGWWTGYLPISFLLFLMSFSSMQLIEAGLWTKLSDVQWNRTLSMIGLLVIILQPLLSISTMQPGNAQKYMLFIYAAFIAVYVIFVLPSTVFKTRVASNGHLLWEWLRPPVWIVATWIFLLVAPLYLRPIYHRRAAFWFTSAAVAVSLFFFYSAGTWGSVWCWISNVVWLYIIADIVVFRNLTCAL